MARSQILLGYDGSEESRHALRWAVRDARLRRAPLTVCNAWHWPHRAGPSDREALRLVGLLGRHTAENGAIVARGIAPALEVRPSVVRGPAAHVLLAASRRAEVVVVGHRGNEGFDGLLVGSVASQLAAHAHCPVVVVRGECAEEPGSVVVGIDGSMATDAALAFAFEEAALRRTDLVAVHAWHRPAAEPAAGDAGRSREEARSWLDHTVTLWREKYPYVPVRTSFVVGTPRPALMDAAEGAELLVVGRRGHGDVRGLLGSVSQYLVHYAPGPIAVVH